MDAVAVTKKNVTACRQIQYVKQNQGKKKKGQTMNKHYQLGPSSSKIKETRSKPKRLSHNKRLGND